MPSFHSAHARNHSAHALNSSAKGSRLHRIVSRLWLGAILTTLPLGAQTSFDGTTVHFFDNDSYWDPIEFTGANSPIFLDIASGYATFGAEVTGTGEFIKTGAGTVAFQVGGNFLGTTTINAGVLTFDVPRLYYDGTKPGTIIVNNGGTLQLRDGNVFGGPLTVPVVSITINEGGVVRKANQGAYTTLANLIFNGGELRAGDLTGIPYPSFQLKGTMTVGGTVASQITQIGIPQATVTLGNNTAGGTTTFAVADVTNSSAADLVISATLGNGFNSSNAPVASGLVKTGTGTLELTGANLYTGSTTLSAGTVSIGHDASLGSGAIILNGGTLAASGGARTLANALTLSGDSTLAGSEALTFTHGLTLAAHRELIVTNTGGTTISGVISQSGGTRSLLRSGGGTLTLTGTNTYTGGTLLAGGTTIINNSTGSVFGTGAVTVETGAILTGAGSFTGAFQNNGIYAPGNSPTLSTLSSFNQGPTGLLLMEIGGLARGTQYDALNITGSATFAGALEVTFDNGFTVAGGESFDLFNWGSLTGTFDTLDLPALTGGLAWDTSALYTSGILSVSTTAIPEPATYAIFFGAGALGLAAWRRRSHHSAVRTV